MPGVRIVIDGPDLVAMSTTAAASVGVAKFELIDRLWGRFQIWRLLQILKYEDCLLFERRVGSPLASHHVDSVDRWTPGGGIISNSIKSSARQT